MKNNDQITVSLECNRPLTNTDLRIALIRRIEMKSEDGFSWTGTYTVENLQDRSAVINTALTLQDIYDTPPYINISGDHFTTCVFYSAFRLIN